MGVCETDGEATCHWMGRLYVHECLRRERQRGRERERWERQTDLLTFADRAEPESITKPASDTKTFLSGLVEARALNQLSDKPSSCFPHGFGEAKSSVWCSSFTSCQLLCSRPLLLHQNLMQLFDKQADKWSSDYVPQPVGTICIFTSEAHYCKSAWVRFRITLNRCDTDQGTNGWYICLFLIPFVMLWISDAWSLNNNPRGIDMEKINQWWCNYPLILYKINKHIWVQQEVKNMIVTKSTGDKQ